jgi:transcriptional regulator with XRE-family HTH domain
MPSGNHMGNARRVRNLVRPLGGLRRIRKEKGITQEDMGKWLGVTKSHYGKFELGGTPLTYHEALKIAKALGVPMEALDGPLDQIDVP